MPGASGEFEHSNPGNPRGEALCQASGSRVGSGHPRTSYIRPAVQPSDGGGAEGHSVERSRLFDPSKRWKVSLE